MASGNVNKAGGGGGAVSSVFTRTGDVVGIETDYPFFGQMTTITKTLYVDVNRVDAYTEDGSLARPFKTISGAAAVATINSLIMAQGGTYTENITLPDGVSLASLNDSKVIIDGNLTTTAGSMIYIRGIQILDGYVMTLNAVAVVEDVMCSGSVIINNVLVRGRNFNMINLSGATALTINGASGHAQLTMSSIGNTGDVPTIKQNAGKTCFVACPISGSRAAGAVVESSTSIFIAYNSKITNSGGGIAADLQNGALASAPNILGSVFATGNIVCGAANTIIEGVQFITSGVLSGSALLLEPAQNIGATTTNFKSILRTADNTLQKVADRIDKTLAFKQLAFRNIERMCEDAPDAILTTTGAGDLQTAITALTDGQLLEIQTNAVYTRIVLPAGKSFRVRAALGFNPTITDTRCIGIKNGAGNIVISGLTIATPANTGGNNNYQGSAITYEDQNAMVDNIVFHNMIIKNTTTGSAVMLSYHWSVGADNYANPPQLAELSTRIAFINCNIYKGCLDGSEGACIAVRGVRNSLFYGNYIDNAGDAGRGIQLQGALDCLIEKNKIYNIGGANAEAIKIDQIGTSPFRQSADIIDNFVDTAIEGIDADDAVSCYIAGNICTKCTDEGITLDGGSAPANAFGVLCNNICYDCGSGILFESGSIGYLINNNSYSNTTNYNMLNGYVPDASNKTTPPVDGYVHIAGTEIITGDKRFSGSLKAGGATDNSEFESDGTLKFNGAATVFDDLPPIPLLSQRVGGANNPTLATFTGNIQLLTFAVNDYVYFNYEFLHDYKEGAAGDFHVHWATNGTEGTEKAVKWEVEYSISNPKSSVPFDASFPASTTISQETAIPANTASLAHIITSFGSLTLTGIKIGAYVTGRIRRIASTGTAPAANPFGITVGIHIEKDTCGSRAMYTK